MRTLTGLLEEAEAEVQAGPERGGAGGAGGAAARAGQLAQDLQLEVARLQRENTALAHASQVRAPCPARDGRR